MTRKISALVLCLAGCAASHTVGDPGPSDAGSSVDASLPVGTELTAGFGEILQLYPAEEGIILVTREGALLLDRTTGSTLTTWRPPRAVTASGFDGTFLAVGDTAVLTVLDPALTEIGSAPLTEPCGSMVVADEHLLVCGAATNEDRIFYTYDLQTRREIARSGPSTYLGMFMRRIPGTDRFLTIDVDIYPHNFAAWRVSSVGEPVLLGEADAFDIEASLVFAFLDFPAARMVTHDGNIHRFESCSPETHRSRYDCFELEGSLGTITPRQTYQALTSDGAGREIYGILEEPNYRVGICGTWTGCTVQVIDAASRTVRRSAPWRTAMDRISAFELDPSDGRLLLASGSDCEIEGPCERWTLYRLDL